MGAIEFKQVEKHYGSVRILSSVNFTLPPDRYYLAAENGAGKSTILEVLSGIQEPNSGDVNVPGGADLVADSIEFPQQLTVQTILSLYQRYQRLDSAACDTLMERFGLDSYLGKSIDSLSQGTLQKLRVVLGFAGNKQWLLLDEPFNGLDSPSQQLLNQLINDSNRPLLLVDHSHLCDAGDLKTLRLMDNQLCIERSSKR